MEQWKKYSENQLSERQKQAKKISSGQVRESRSDYVLWHHQGEYRLLHLLQLLNLKKLVRVEEVKLYSLVARSTYQRNNIRKSLLSTDNLNFMKKDSRIQTHLQ